MNDYENTPEMRLRFIRIRESLGLSQRQMSRRMGLSYSFYGKLETGEGKFNEHLFVCICSIFGVREKYLSDGELPIFDTEMVDAKQVYDIYCRLSPAYQKCLLEFSQFLDSKSTADDSVGGETNFS